MQEVKLQTLTFEIIFWFLSTCSRGGGWLLPQSASRCWATCSQPLGRWNFVSKWGLYKQKWKYLFEKMLNARWTICSGSSRFGEVEVVSWEGPHHGYSPSQGENFLKNFNISFITTSSFHPFGCLTTNRMSAFYCL